MRSERSLEEPQQQMVRGSQSGEEGPGDGLEGQELEESVHLVGDQEAVTYSTCLTRGLPETEGEGDDGNTSAESASPLVVSLKSPAVAEKSLHLVGLCSTRSCKPKHVVGGGSSQPARLFLSVLCVCVCVCVCVRARAHLSQIRR